MQKYGTLFLIPTEMGEQSPNRLFPEYNLQIIRSTQHFICENSRTTRRVLKKICNDIHIEQLEIFEFDKHSPQANTQQMIAPLLNGHNIGLMSEAGMPCIADPGNIIVEKAHELGIQVVPLVGPNSIIMALIASGFNGQNFSFHGYIPIKEGRTKALQNMELMVLKNNQTQIFMETPYRNTKLLEELFHILKPGTKLCIACDISLDTEFIQTKTIQDWKKNTPNIHKRPTIFLIG